MNQDGMTGAHARELAEGDDRASKVPCFNIVCIIATLLVSATTSCTTKGKAERKAHAAYVAGQQQVLAQMQAQSSTSSQITVVGEVQHSVFDWQEGLSLSQAIVAANYLGPRDPLQIIVFRRGQVIGVNPKDLLRGRGDILLEPGDRIEIQR